MGTPMIMGRKTFQSFSAPLPGRRHIVLTRDRDWHGAGAEIAHDVGGALALAGETETVSIIGGAEIFQLFLPLAAPIERPEVHHAADRATPIPPLDLSHTE